MSESPSEHFRVHDGSRWSATDLEGLNRALAETSSRCGSAYSLVAHRAGRQAVVLTLTGPDGTRVLTAPVRHSSGVTVPTPAPAGTCRDFAGRLVAAANAALAAHETFVAAQRTQIEFAKIVAGFDDVDERDSECASCQLPAVAVKARRMAVVLDALEPNWVLPRHEGPTPTIDETLACVDVILDDDSDDVDERAMALVRAGAGRVDLDVNTVRLFGWAINAGDDAQCLQILERVAHSAEVLGLGTAHNVIVLHDPETDARSFTVGCDVTSAGATTRILSEPLPLALLACVPSGSTGEVLAVALGLVMGGLNGAIERLNDALTVAFEGKVGSARLM